MKYINKEMHLDVNDFDFGDFSNTFQIKVSGWKKIFTYFKLDYNENDDAQTNFNKLKPKLKQITGSRIYKFSGSKSIDPFYNTDFGESSLLTLLKVLSVIKEDVDTIYTDTGNYYENAIRSSLNQTWKIQSENTFSLKPENTNYMQPCYVNGQLVKADLPVNTVVPTGNIFNLKPAKINYENNVYDIDLSIFGGMPDGYPTFMQESSTNFYHPFDLVEIKTKTFYKFKNNVSQDEFGEYNYDPITQPAIRTYEFVYNPNNELVECNFISQRSIDDFNLLDEKTRFLKQKFANGFSSKRVEITGVFPVMELGEDGLPLYVPSKASKQFKTIDDKLVFKINDPGYYCQAALYALFTWLNKQIPTLDENNTPIYYISNNDLAQLKVLFAMGILKPERYVKFDENGALQLGTLNDGKHTRAISTKEKEMLLSVDEVYTELYKASDLKLLNKASRYSSNHHLENGYLNLITLLAECSDRYLSFFKDHKGFELKDSNDKKTANMLKRYFVTLNNKKTKNNI